MACAHRSTVPTRENRCLVPFPVALERLRERYLDATPHELGMWVAFDDLPAWLPARRRGQSQQLPFTFSWCYDSARRDTAIVNWDFTGPLGAVWFKPHEIDGFNPADRWLNYTQVVERWRGRLNPAQVRTLLVTHALSADAVSLLRGKGNLYAFHPYTGGAREIMGARMTGQPDNDAFAPIEMCMFPVSAIDGLTEALCAGSVPVAQPAESDDRNHHEIPFEAAAPSSCPPTSEKMKDICGEREVSAQLARESGLRVESRLPSEEDALRGAKRSKYNASLQDAINLIEQELKGQDKSMTAGNLRDWLADKKAVSSRPSVSWEPWSFEPPISNCDELYIDGAKLVWTDRDGREQDITLRSLEPYFRRACNRTPRPPIAP
jgi:hypothetical protein